MNCKFFWTEIQNTFLSLYIEVNHLLTELKFMMIVICIISFTLQRVTDEGRPRVISIPVTYLEGLISSQGPDTSSLDLRFS
jgi:hypothetical protein